MFVSAEIITVILLITIIIIIHIIGIMFEIFDIDYIRLRRQWKQLAGTVNTVKDGVKSSLHLQ